MANEVRLIDANALIEDITAAEENAGMGAVVAGTLRRYVNRRPTIDPEGLRPVGRKEHSAISKTGLMCTNCYSDVDRDAVFCKYCGAKMEG